MRSRRGRCLATCLSFLLLFSRIAISDTGSESRQDGPVEVVSIKQDGIDLRIHNKWGSLVSVGVCDNPQRLSGLAFHLERLEGHRWKVVHPEGVILGDFPPKMLRIPVGTSVLVPVVFSARFMGIRRGDKIRVVLTVWHTEESMIGWPIFAGEKGTFEVVSASFVYSPERQRD